MPPPRQAGKRVLLQVSVPVIASKWRVTKKMEKTKKEKLVYSRIHRDFGWAYLLKPSAPKITQAAVSSSYAWAKVHKRIRKDEWVKRCMYIDVKKWSARNTAAMKKHQNAQNKVPERAPLPLYL